MDSAEPGICVICGEKCLGKHYGISACLGCKTFFRRAVIHGQDVFCEKDGCCNLTEARKACRGCRYRKCLDSGMTRDALKPRRDLIGLGKVKAQKQRSPDDSPASIDSSAGSWKGDLLSLVARLTELDVMIRKQKYELIKHRQDMISMVDLLSFRKPDPAGTLRVTSARDLAYVLEIDLLMMLEWAKCLPIFTGMPTQDKMIILRRFSLYYLLLEHGCHTADSNLDGVWLVSNGTCWPRNIEELPEPARRNISADWKWRQEKLYRDLTSVYIDEVSTPLRRLKLSPEELTILKIVVLLPNAEMGLSDATRSRVDAFRDKAIHALFEHYRHINYEDYPVRYGSLILMISGISAATTVMMENYQLMRLFKIVYFDTIAQMLLFNI